MSFGFVLTILLSVFVGVGPVAAVPVGTDTSDAPRGALTGRVVDQTTKQPLPGANVYIERLDRGTATRNDGRFTLDGLPTGTYTVRVSMVGYETVVRGPVPVTNGRPHQLSVTLQPTVVQTDGVEVTANYYETAADAPTSLRTLGTEEIRRAPGAAVGNDRRDHFAWGTVTSYVEVQNVTGRRNVATRLYDADTHSVEDVTHWGRFFVGGVKVEL
ncbi:carboxypeptidase-like regulatory domain-containing protein [Salinibacter sp. 10B]|uniref:carboxypeptidase-like regulatory domain-containing protein n=1 Tax=Salinibacter sp. 10B TaxID=1923971 RepID=UPI0015E46A74|nr:carboxypeptidase-like regulatory domain-containing protein [Salinibacter sp. 10B]